MEDNTRIKTCSKCGCRFIESKGFYKRSDGKGYRNECKKCFVATTIECTHKKRDYKFETHLFKESNDEFDICKRCGMERRKKADPFIFNRWRYEYLVDKKWTSNHPPCIKQK